MKNVKIKKILRNLLLGIVICFSCLSTPKIEAAETLRYMAIVLYDEYNGILSYDLYKDDYNNLRKKSEKICSTNSSGFDNVCNLKGNKELFQERNYNLNGTGKASDKNNGLGKLVFPNIAITESSVNVSQKDYVQANSVTSTLVNNLNEAISFVRRNSSSGISLSELSKSLATAAYNRGGEKLLTGEIYYRNYASLGNDKSFASVKEKIDNAVKNTSGTERQGLTESDYIIMYKKSADGKISDQSFFVCAYPIGYSSGQYYYLEEYNEKVIVSNGKAAWGDIVMMAETAKNSPDGTLTVDKVCFDTLANPGMLEKTLNEFLDNQTQKIDAEKFGFYSIEGMMLNRGTRGQSYYLGLMPYNWFEKANTVFWVAEIIAVFILIASILYTVYQENYAIVSPAVKINLQDRVQNLLIAILLLIMYVPLFYILAKFNHSIVELLDSLVSGSVFKYSKANMNTILAFVMSVFNLGIMVKINFDYLVRALTITVLHIISPVAIASISISDGKNRKYFNTWLKEMVSAMFLQTFDAVILVTFILILQNGRNTGKWWEVAFMTFMLMPLNSWFKRTFGGSSSIGDMANQTRQNAKSGFEKTWGAAAFVRNTAGNIMTAKAKRNNEPNSNNNQSSQEGADTPSTARKNTSGNAQNTNDVERGPIITEAIGKEIDGSSKPETKSTNNDETEKQKTNSTNKKQRKPMNPILEGVAITTLKKAGMGDLAYAIGEKTSDYYKHDKKSSSSNQNNNFNDYEEKKENQKREESKRINVGSYEMEEDNKYIEPYNNDLQRYQEQIDLEQKTIKEKAFCNNEQEFDAGEDAEFNENALDYSQIINDERCNTYAQAKGIKPEKARQELTTIINDKNIPITERKQNLVQTLANAKTENTINKDVERKVYNDIGGKNIYEVGRNATDMAHKISNNNKEIYGNVFEKPFNKIKNDKSLTDDQKHEKYTEVLAPYMKKDYLKENNIQRKNNDNFTPQPKS